MQPYLDRANSRKDLCQANPEIQRPLQRPQKSVMQLSFQERPNVQEQAENLGAAL